MASWFHRVLPMHVVLSRLHAMGNSDQRDCVSICGCKHILLGGSMDFRKQINCCAFLRVLIL